jgi:MoaA/NifB/PqqE/SkfB family radical SAM enzyme
MTSRLRGDDAGAAIATGAVVAGSPPRMAALLAMSGAELGRAAASGVAHAALVVAGATDAAHDWVRVAPGELARIREAIAAAREHRIRILAITPLHRSAYRSLADIAAWLVAQRVDAWAVSALAHGATRDLPRLALALPFALHAIDRARRRGIEAHIARAPLCLLGPLAEHALDSEPQTYGAPCERCPSRPRCPGISAAYLERFGDRELFARDAPQRSTGITARLLARAVSEIS